MLGAMRKLANHITVLVTLVLLCPGLLPGTPAVQRALAKWSQGRRIEVVLNNGQRSVGRLGTVETDSFVLNPDKKSGAARVLRVDEVRSISTKMTTAKKWGIAAAVYGVVCLIGAVVLGN